MIGRLDTEVPNIVATSPNCVTGIAELPAFELVLAFVTPELAAWTGVEHGPVALFKQVPRYAMTPDCALTLELSVNVYCGVPPSPAATACQ